MSSTSARRVGLPETLRMRHDSHFVEQLARPGGVAIGRLVPIEDLLPNARQPRQSLGDISELVSSLREKGMLEPILVRPMGSRFEIIAGERRYRAAMEAGLAEVPCIVREASDSEVMELALVENMQRRDLTPFEEAEGMRVLGERYKYTHEMLAERLGKGRTSITESLSLTAMPDDVRQLCRLADIQGKSLLLQIVRQGDPRKMVALIERLQREGTTRREARRIVKEGKKGRGRPRPFVFRYQPREKTFDLKLQFKKSDVPRDEIIEALEGLLRELRASARA